MVILGDNYRVIDTFDWDITVPDCLVTTKNKIGTGHGEAKLYIASKDIMYSFYGAEQFNALCFLLKEDLKQYMYAIKKEYFKPTYNYKGKKEMHTLWNDRMKQIEELDDIIYFNITDQYQIKGPRGYINSNDFGYQLIREISLPLVSYISVMKLEFNNQFIFYWKLFVDYDMLSAEDALVFNYGRKKGGVDSPTILPTKKEKEISNARLGQGKYRELLLEECLFCPITMINDDRLLIASHIKPWAVCNNKEKIDPKNGFILSPLYDKLFDRGLITFTDKKEILISNWLSPSNIKRINLKQNTRYPKLPIDDKRSVYLEYHRNYVFKG